MPLLSEIILLIIYTLNLPNFTSAIGTITSDISYPIMSDLSNANEYTSYTFQFKLESELTTGGHIEVQFPEQFEPGLGITNLAQCVPSCIKTEKTVKWSFSEAISAGLVEKVIIHNVKNPTTMGGTGQFMIFAKKDNVILDENRIFGLIGISGKINPLVSTVVAIDSQSKSNAGENARYIFSFKVQSELPNTMYIRIV